MGRVSNFGVSLILILAMGHLVACSNAIPTVESLTSKTQPTVPTVVPAKNAKSFAEINAGSARETLTGGYKGNLRIGQAVGSLQGTSGGGYRLKGTVTLQR